MPEQLLHGSEIGARIEQMRCKRMAQRVHVQLLAPRERSEQPFHRELHAARRDALTPHIHKHRPVPGADSSAQIAEPQILPEGGRSV
jgi:hypothetical protein